MTDADHLEAVQRLADKDAIRECVHRYAPGHEDVSEHHGRAMTSHFSDVAGDEAHAVTYVLLTLCRKDGKTVQTDGGRYVDRLQRRDGEWRVVLRQLVIDWRMNSFAPAPESKRFNDPAAGTT